ncbi:hypothetical protein SAMN05216167_113146 [Spirosoma endophyticum]|uniref:Uncharacterized protein n=1 Tax=Spirosoma endophyticum TaxID=662367 RepID=A0A1I2ACH9_9BACT|nr:hypothetical protein SAMN05216167_113146 [Spirosoma endophyticum]
MAMRTTSLFVALVSIVLSSCSPKEPLPEVWSQSCVQLAPYQGIYRLTGMCCSTLDVPRIDVQSDLTFSTVGNLYTNRFADTAGRPILVTGNLSPDRSTLTIHYLTQSYTLKPGYATASCYCVCQY